jgi:hypothetical protein
MSAFQDKFKSSMKPYNPPRIANGVATPIKLDSVLAYAPLRMIFLKFRLLSSCVAQRSSVSKGVFRNYRTQVTKTRLSPR